ncbi:A24 family peptidase [Psychrobium sp. 1_MG-2023]|uniref:prepilin peptidase n=1 Tax=Psychrobium sp. 1_MG-2023 TaxID=3062624 RepID=UPI000C342C7E|nr:A24 family peptidase [Psychrobium sp. 1_MG-2023]MDP2562034.1 A24 family peptidase [Psychrobium sp. 1_MG-2023]PKF58521.1 prepilin peptidase [Alteromonadales bacterium alter-6D02]
MNDFVNVMVNYPWYFYGVITILGLLVGSFLNVVIHRLPIMMEREFKAEAKEYFELPDEKDSTAKHATAYNLIVPRSGCPKCGHQITARENIPVVSYLWLKGKCSQCQTPISTRYPMVELITGILSLVVACTFGPTWQCVAALCFTWSLVALTFIDFDTMLLPDSIVLPMLWFGLIINLNGTFVDLNSAVIGAVAGYMSLWTVFWLFKILTGKDGMGYGDFKLFALIGAWLGWQYLPLTIILSSLVGAIIGITILAVRGQDKNIPIPFGPYLAIAGWIALIWGEQINQLYLQSIGL